MKTLIAVMFLTSATIAPALALSPGASSQNTSPEVIAIAGGCGAGYHRGPFNGCLKNYADPGAHPCPRGFHIGPNGGCIGNGR